MVISGYPPAKKAGMERGCQRMADALVRRGHQVMVLTLSHPDLPPKRTEGPGIDVLRVINPVAVGPLWGLTYMRQVQSWMEKLRHDYDVVLCHKLYLHSVAVARAGRKLGKPTATLLVNAGEFSDIKVLRDHKGGEVLLKEALRQDAFFCLSHQSRKELLTEGVSEDSLRSYHYIVDVEKFSPPTTPLEDEAPFVYMGRLHEQKNIPLLMNVYTAVQEEESNVRLEICGSGPEAAALCQSDGLRHQEWVENPEDQYRRALAVVTASNAEGLSNVLIEAMASGAPVITTDVSGARDAIDPEGDLPSEIPDGEYLRGRGGLLTAIGDKAALVNAWLTLYRDRVLRDELSHEARTRALEAFQESVVIPKLEEDLFRLANPKGVWPKRRIAICGGIDKIHVRRWATALREEGHEVCVFSDKPAPEGWSGVPVVQPKWTLLQNIKTYKLQGGEFANNRDKWKAYRQSLADFDPDIIHAQEALAYGPMLDAFPESLRILTPWGPDVERALDEGGERLELVRRAFDAADCITTNAVGCEVRWSEKLDQPLDKFDFFTWGTDLSLFHPKSKTECDSIRRELGIGENDKVLLSPRLARPYYRIETILMAWKQAKVCGKLILLRAGAPEEEWEQWLELIRLEQITDVLPISRLLSPEEMACVYTIADGTIMIPETDLAASSLIECLACASIPLVESLECYQPIVGFDDDEKACGVILPSHDINAVTQGMKDLFSLALEDQKKWQQLNVSYCQRFQDWRLAVDNLQRVYTSSIRKP